MPEVVLPSPSQLPFNPPAHASDSGINEPQIGSTLWTLDEELGTTGDSCCPWRITKSSYEQICSNMSLCSTSLPLQFTMPSRHTLSRFLEGYFRGFHEHLPFLHLPTLLLSEIPTELLMSIAAMGALYKFEHGKAYELYFVAKELVTHRLRAQTWAYSRHLVGVSPNYEGTSTGLQPVPSTLTSDASPPDSCGTSEISGFLEPDQIIHLLQSVIILTSMSSWGEGALITESLELAGRLSALVRLSYMGNSDIMSSDTPWKDWIQREERRRTLLAAYALLNTQSIAFNVPPAISNRDVALFLPHPTNLWRAATAAKWEKARRESPHQERSFRHVLGSLLSGQGVSDPTQISAFGNFIMIHALVQQIFTERQAVGLRGHDSPLHAETLSMLDRALRSWKNCWRKSPEATLDPLSSNGPIAFTSTALLRIAYIRMNADLGPYRQLFIRNPSCLANSVTRTPIPRLDRTTYTDIAVLQCIHALGVIVRSGVQFVSHTHTQSWSVVHSLSSIECACLLSLWLRTIADVVSSQGSQELRKEEMQLLGMITSVVLETSSAEEIEGEQHSVRRIRKLAAFTVKVWADALKGEHMFQMVQTIAKGLSLASDILVKELE